MNSSIGVIGGADGPTAIFITGNPFGITNGFIGPAMWYIICALAVIIAYFLGNISPAILIGRAHGIDIRKVGSGNAGTTNVQRTLGNKAGLLTLAIDVAKGATAVFIGKFAASFVLLMKIARIEMLADDRLLIDVLCENLPYMCALAVFVGHIWPILFGFKGGKGVAAALGAVICVQPLLALSALGIFIIIVALTKYISLGSVTAALSIPFLSYVFEPAFMPFGCAMAAVLIFKHRGNIKKLIKHEESKFSFRKKEQK